MTSLLALHRNLVPQCRLEIFRRAFNSTVIWRHERPTVPKPPPLPSLETPACMKAAQQWVDDFTRPGVEINRDLVSLSFARSSGPGGQNVNKVETKATVEVPIDAWWIPQWARSGLMKDPHYVASTKRIQISGSVHRSQSANVDFCLTKLRNMVLSCATMPIKKEPTKEQKAKVAKHMESYARVRKIEKQKRSSVKQSRRDHRGGGRGGYDY